MKSFPLQTGFGAKVGTMKQLMARHPNIAQHPIVQVQQMQAAAGATPPRE